MSPNPVLAHSGPSSALTALPRTRGTALSTAAVEPGTSPLLAMLPLTLSKKRSMGTLMKTTSRMDWMMMMASFRVFLLRICWMLL